MDFNKVKEFWQKWSVLICAVLLGYSLYKTFSPNIKTIEKTVVDTEATTKLQRQIETLTQTNKTLNKQVLASKETSKNITEDETIVETVFPDGRIERRIEKRKRDTSTTVVRSSTSVNGTSTTISTSSESFKVETSSKTHIDTSKVTEVNPVPFWTTYMGYQYNQQEIIVGQGINIGNHIGFGLIGSYKVIENKNRFDYGGILAIRY